MPAGHTRQSRAQHSNTGAATATLTATATTVAATTTMSNSHKIFAYVAACLAKGSATGRTTKHPSQTPDQTRTEPEPDQSQADHPITVPRLRSRPARPSSIEQAIDQCDFATASTSTLHKSTRQRRRRRRCQFPSAVATGPKVD